MAAPLPRVRLLGALLAAVSASGCNSVEQHDATYLPGRPIGDVQHEMPGLPCAEKGNPELAYLNPGCTEDFAVLSGPRQGIDAQGNATCNYTVEYALIDGCSVGRPLSAASGEARVAVLMRATSPWG